MKNFSILSVLLFSALVFGLFSCSTDVELNAPKDTKTMIFGLLDSKADTQFIKINRTFLGEGDNFLYAAIRDSVEYPFNEFTAKVEGINWQGAVTQSFTLDTITITKRPGLFAERQTAYYLVSDQLTSDLTYRLSIEFNNGETDCFALTNVIATLDGDNNIASPNTQSGVKLVNQNPGQENVVYNELFRIRYNSTNNAKRYDAALRFWFVEKKWSGTPYSSDLLSSELRFVDWNVGTRKIENPESSTEIDYRINANGFFNVLKTSLGSTPSTISREIGKGPGLEEECFDFILTVGNEELNTWLDVNQPVTGIITERPFYSNIDGGLGLFASRTTQGLYDLRTFGSSVNATYDPKTKHEICLGLSMINLRFCSTSAEYDSDRPFYYLNRIW